jgi:DNA polymerase II large subunit
MSMARKYKISDYLRQHLEILERQILSVLGKEKEKQEGLGKWFG